MQKRITSVFLMIAMLLALFSGSALAAHLTFPDAAGHWAEDIINTLAEKGVIAGYPDGTVGPDNLITRGEFAALLVRDLEFDTSGIAKAPPTFKDIDGYWSEANIETLVSKGIIDPADYDGYLLPDKPITRIEIIRMMVRSVGKGDEAEKYTGSTAFADDSKIDSSDKGYVHYAQQYDLVTGYPDNTIRPDGESTRAEAFALLLRQEVAVQKIKEETKNDNSDSGGSVSYPNAQVSFELLPTTHVDTSISIVTTLQNIKSLTWSLTKETADGAQAPIEFSDALDGSLTTDGGTITFKDIGSYILTATAINYVGRETVCSRNITVYPVNDVSFDLPETTHTDKMLTISNAAKLGGIDIAWTLTKDGEAVELDTAIEGSLSNEGGTIQFLEKGSYVLTASVTDATGRNFSHNEAITVYPVPSVVFELPETAHTDTATDLTTTLSEMNGLTAEWSLTRNGEAVNISDYIDSFLTNEGGNIRFVDKGVYSLKATVTDATGRAFEHTSTVTVYPVGMVGFYLPEITHTNKTIAVEATFENIDTITAVWSITKDGADVTFSDYINGTLTNDGGTIRFTDKGSYILTAAFTDGAGRTYSYSLPLTVYPVPTLNFPLPSTAHTDTDIKVDTVNTDFDGLTVEWFVDNTYGFQDWNTYISGSLTNDGGTIRFKRPGVYELVARVADATGRVFLFEPGDKINVLPVLNIQFALPETTYPDRTIDLRTIGNNNVLPVEWSLVKDGISVSLSTYIEGTLNAQGGKIRFTEYGDYVLTTSMTDALDRTFSCSDSITIYPIPEISLTLPQIGYASEPVTIAVSGTNLDNLTASWTITPVGGDTAPYSDYAVGDLGNEGGNIAFNSKGSYSLDITMTDALGRTFSKDVDITIYPIPKIDLTVPQTGYPNEPVTISVGGTDLDNLTYAWTVSKYGGIPSPYTDFVVGDLGDEGGSITFNSKGSYSLTVTVTDMLGRAFSESADITIYPIPEIILTIPQAGYPHEPVTISVDGTDLDGLTSAWTVSKDGGSPSPYTDYATGSLNNNGGSVTFNERGSYEIAVVSTDALGRTFSKSAAITVYPIPQMQISLPQLNYSGEAFTVNATGSELDGSDITWSISVDGGSAVLFTNYASGTLSASGGAISINTNKTISVKLIASATDDNGRSFTFTSSTVTIKPIVQCVFALPSSTHIGKAFSIIIQNTSGIENNSIVWSLTKDGGLASFTGSLNNNGGSITIGTVGTYMLIATITDSAGRVFTHAESLNITNTAPNTPTASAIPTRTISNGKFLVNFVVSSTDPDGDAVTYEYLNNSSDGYYAAGSYTVKVRAIDAFGAYSDWKDISFSVNNSAPSTPVITRTPSGNSVPPGTPITISASATDPDGDNITYVWDNRAAQTQTYPLGKNTVKVKAVDTAGAESPWVAITFFVSDANSGGGMTLTGPESVILEPGLAGATITQYTFTVPPVDGHSGQDFGRVRGYNVTTGGWDQLDYQTTSNGITFTRSLPPGVYSQLEFYYYTNHNCMYNKSNITYSVTYYFE